jgi:hypothetical protein
MATIDWTAEVLDQIDTHWQERLRPRLEGLSDDDCLIEGFASTNGLLRRAPR